MENLKGKISEIERYAVKDGPGIRTVVFFKGCPLSCKWCANPETQKSVCQLMYWQTRCIGCRKCIKTCPNKALSFGENGVVIDRTLCRSCGKCTDTCNSRALTMAGEGKTVDEIMVELRKDKLFYQTSGGGVTFSGGECTSQSRFLAALARACKKEDISTCIETSGYAPWEVFEELLTCIDYFYYDLKLIDEDQHKEYTGVSSRRIKENFIGLKKAGADVTVRIPCIPGINTTEKNIQDTIAFLEEHAPACHVSLLPYHRLGTGKYHKLDMEYTLSELLPPSEEDMQELKEEFEARGFYITIGE